MQVTFQLDSAELNNGFLEAIKKVFAGKKINILVSEIEEEYNPAFVEKIKNASDSKVRYVFKDDDFEQFAQQLLANEPVEIDTTFYT
jgi:hypothetical protein